MSWKHFEYSIIPLKDPAKRPYVEVTLKRGGKQVTLPALVDSGSRRTVIEKGSARLLGIDVRTCKETPIAGIMGEGVGY